MSDKTKKILITILAWLTRAAIFPALAAWVLVRLWVPFGDVFPTDSLISAAMAIAAVLLVLEAACKLTQDRKSVV